jgi:hypothetical protein
MVKLTGGNALFGIVLGAAMVGLGLTQHLTLLTLIGAYVALVSLWRWVDDARDRDRGR